MRHPESPPQLDELYRSVQDPSRLRQIMSAPSQPSARERYPHWDRLRRYAPPPGLSHKEWWLGIKLRRNGAFKDITLRDKAGSPFRYHLPDPIPEHLHTIDLGAGGRIQMPDQITNPDTRDRYYVGRSANGRVSH
jgi:hypothetical protein